MWDPEAEHFRVYSFFDTLRQLEAHFLPFLIGGDCTGERPTKEKRKLANRGALGITTKIDG